MMTFKLIASGVLLLIPVAAYLFRRPRAQLPPLELTEDDIHEELHSRND